MRTPIHYLLLILFVTSPLLLAAQSAEEVKEKRAREMHRVLLLNDPEAWKKFVKENYSEALINTPMRAQVDGDGPSAAAATQQAPADPLAEKTRIFKMLHSDFGDSKITSIQQSGDRLEMKVKDAGGLTGTFQLTFTKTAPYLIDGLGIEAANDR